jgi:hypothetical protein
MRGGRLVRSLLPPGKDSARPDSLPPAQYKKLAGALTYLYDSHGPAAVRRVLGVQVKGFGNGVQLLYALGVREGCRREAARWLYGSLAPRTPIPVQAGTAYFVSTDASDAGDITGPGETRMQVQGSGVTLAIGGERYRAELAPLLRILTLRTPGGCVDHGRASTRLTVADARVPLLDATGAPRGELVVTMVTFGNMRPDPAGKLVPAGAMKLERVAGLAIIRG